MSHLQCLRRTPWPSCMPMAQSAALQHLATYCAVACPLQGLAFSSLPPGLADGTVLEVFDMWGNQVLGGILPPKYANWTNLGVFK